jgi:FMN-dependent NADH-azoreductase
MSKLLYIESSPRKERSISVEVAQQFIDDYRASSVDNKIVKINLWDMELPEFDGDYINAKYQVLHGESPTAGEQNAWAEITEIVDQFKGADHYLFSIPMWNFSIPYKLKHYIDIITQPGLTFSFSPDSGYEGLITGKTATIILSRGGEYSNDETRGMDFQLPYMKHFLGFIGFQDINTILLEPALTDPESLANTVSTAKNKAIEIVNKL